MTGNENSMLIEIAKDIGEIKTDVAVVKTKFEHMEVSQDDMLQKIERNTTQISEIRSKSIFQMGKFWPYLIGVAGAAFAFIKLFGDKIFK